MFKINNNDGQGKGLTFQALLLECGSMKEKTEKKIKPVQTNQLVSMPDDKNFPVASHTGLQRYSL